MIKHLIISGAIVFSISATQAQFVTNYKKAGDQFYAKGDYYSAAQFYEKHVNGKAIDHSGYQPYLVQKQGTAQTSRHKENEPSPELVYKLADSYYKLNDYTHAEPWFKLLVDKYGTGHPRARYRYATCLRANGHYNEAQQQLEIFLKQYTLNDEYNKLAKQELDNCLFIQQQLSNTKHNTKVEKLNGNINKEGANYAAAWPDNKTLVFTSTRTDDSDASKTTYANTLYSATLQSGGFGEAGKLAIPPVKGRQMGTAAFTPDDRKIYFTGWYANKEGAIISGVYLSEKKDGHWSEPILVDGSTEVTAGFNSRHPHITPDGKYLLLSSDRPGGQGGFDIWYAELDQAGRPGKIVNMGPVINTPADEEAPFYHAGSNTLVFASKGRTGMGGFDLFASAGSFTGTWSTAENLGYPVNSVKDDSYFTGKGKFLLEDALISSDRSGVCCLELFAIHKNYKQVISGQVTDCGTQSPLANVRIRATDAQGKTIAGQTTGEPGTYLIEVDAGASLQISGQLEGYENNRVEVRETAGDTVYAAVLCLTKVPDPFKGKETLVTRDIYFEFAKTSITPSSFTYLDQMAAYLKANPGIRLELAAHTDGIGSSKSNLVLSQDRAEACVTYLVNAGASPEQLIAKGYGECCPIEKETIKGKDNPGAREKNRRVEFRIIK